MTPAEAIKTPNLSADQLTDIIDVYSDFAVSSHIWIWFSLAAAAALIATALLWRWWRKRRKTKLPNPLTPMEILQASLTQLQTIGTENAAAFYAQARIVINHFLFLKIQSNMDSLTAEELLTRAKSHPSLSADCSDSLSHLLSHHTAAVFAGETIAPEIREQEMIFLQRLIVE